MFCMACGKQIPDAAAFCVFCGTPVDAMVAGGVQSQGMPAARPQQPAQHMQYNVQREQQTQTAMNDFMQTAAKGANQALLKTSSVIASASAKMRDNMSARIAANEQAERERQAAAAAEKARMEAERRAMLGPVCPSCGFQLKKGDIFCKRCGTRMSEEALQVNGQGEAPERSYEKSEGSPADTLAASEETMEAAFVHPEEATSEAYDTLERSAEDTYEPPKEINTETVTPDSEEPVIMPGDGIPEELETDEITMDADEAPAFCIYCGNRLQEGDLFCEKCGKKVEG